MSTLTKTDQKIDGFIGDSMDYIYYRYRWSDDLPNHLMWLRLVLSPIQLVLLALGLERRDGRFVLLALVILTIQALTDLLDGYVARKHDCTSASGARWDPLADKTMVLPTMLLLIVWSKHRMVNDAGWWLMSGTFGLIVALETISIIWYALNPHGMSNRWGKYKLDCQVLGVWLGMFISALNVNGDARFVAIAIQPFMVASICFATLSLLQKLRPA